MVENHVFKYDKFNSMLKNDIYRIILQCFSWLNISSAVICLAHLAMVASCWRQNHSLCVVGLYSASEFDNRLRPSVFNLSRQALCDLRSGNRVVSPPRAVNPRKSNTLSVSQVILCTPNGSAPYYGVACASQVGPTDESCVLCDSGRLNGVSEFVFLALKTKLPSTTRVIISIGKGSAATVIRKKNYFHLPYYFGFKTHDFHIFFRTENYVAS
jgi:hypothetical protein